MIAALLGLLFAFNAMLLTVPERRQAIADLRIDGAKRPAIVEMVLFEGLCLGAAASIVGLLGGYALSRGVFHESPGYLAQTFVLGGGTVIGVQPVVLAFAGGVAAALLASVLPLLDLQRRRAIDAVYFDEGTPGNALRGRTQRRLFASAVALVVPAGILFAVAPSAAILAVVLLAIATVLAVPLALAGAIRIAGMAPARLQSATLLPLALTSLRATTIRSLALAATGAIALFGTVALGGARTDLLASLHNFAQMYSDEASVWVLNPRDTAGVVSFSANAAARIRAVPGVTGVYGFQSEFMDVGGRRVWVIARPPSAAEQLLRSEVVSGNVARAARELREGGWVAVSQPIAAEDHVGVGGALVLPTPTGPARLRVAAITTNLGWTAGALLLNTADYSRLWATRSPSALGVELAPGTDPARARKAIAQALGPSTGLEAITATTRASRFGAIAGEGLSRLAEISRLLVVAAVLALVAALGSAIWERRTSLSGLRLEGSSPSRLRRILMTESILMLGAGCVTGVVAGNLRPGRHRRLPPAHHRIPRRDARRELAAAGDLRDRARGRSAVGLAPDVVGLAGVAGLGSRRGVMVASRHHEELQGSTGANVPPPVSSDDPLPVARAGAALLGANLRYWSTVAPLARSELRRWVLRASAIATDDARRIALAKLDEEGFNSEVASTLAACARAARRAQVVTTIVALEVLYDYLDGLIALPAVDPRRDGEEIFSPFTEMSASPRTDASGSATACAVADGGGYAEELAATVSVGAGEPAGSRSDSRCVSPRRSAHR